MINPRAAALYHEVFHAQPPPPDPYPHYEWMRECGRLVRVADDTWLTTRHDLALAVLHHPDLGNDAERACRVRAGADWQTHPSMRVLAGMLLMANPPRHTELRRSLAPHLSAQQVRSLRPMVQQHVEELCKQLLDAGELDFVAGFAEVLPRRVIADVIGIPKSERIDFHHQTLAFNAVFERNLTPDMLAAADAAAAHITDYVNDLVASARRRPRLDLLSSLVDYSDAGLLPAEELVGLVYQVYNASYQTVLGMLGNGLAALLDRPEQHAQLRDDPSLAAAVVVETLRFDPPVQSTGRHAMTASALAGTPVVPGELVVVVLAAANRDPDRYVDPHRFDLLRRRPGLAFGYGAHHCIGAALATLQGEIAFSALTQRLAIEPNGVPRRHPRANIRSFDELPVRVRPVVGAS